MKHDTLLGRVFAGLAYKPPAVSETYPTSGKSKNKPDSRKKKRGRK